MYGFLRPILAVAMLLVSAGCAVTQTYRAAGFTAPAEGSRVLRMPADIEVSVLTTGGLLEPRADWTSAARRHVDGYLDEILSGYGETMIPYEEPDDLDKVRRHVQMIKLHEAVGGAILTHKVNQPDSYEPAIPLPTVKNRFEYSLGPDPGGLGDNFDADYALFVFLRDSHESAGRAIAAGIAAALGADMTLGAQAGFASLVDLRSGDVVWFNHLFDPSGDLRKGNEAADAVRQLLSDFPL
jgi:hypothetical protein